MALGSSARAWQARALKAHCDFQPQVAQPAGAGDAGHYTKRADSLPTQAMALTDGPCAPYISTCTRFYLQVAARACQAAWIRINHRQSPASHLCPSNSLGPACHDAGSALPRPAWLQEVTPSAWHVVVSSTAAGDVAVFSLGGLLMRLQHISTGMGIGNLRRLSAESWVQVRKKGVTACRFYKAWQGGSRLSFPGH